MLIRHATGKRACPACTSGDILTCADRGDVPLFQNARYASAAAARAAPCGRLVLTLCRNCGFGFNATFEPALVRYAADYENDQTVSEHFLRHVDSIARRALDLLQDGQQAVVVEIGCGQGGFLRHLAGMPGTPVVQAVGFDPSLRQPVSEGALRLEARLFDQAAAQSLTAPPDLVVLRHVIEHVDEPFDVLTTIRGAMGQATGRILIETPCLDWILRHESWHDVFYEHCNYFTATSLAGLLRRAGFSNIEVDHVFGGQYLVATGDVGQAAGAPEPSDDGAMAARAQAFGRSLASYVDAWRGRLTGLQPLAIWGAGAKGVTFAALIGPAVPLAGLIDIDPKKQGRYAAMTALPILAPAEAVALGIRHVVVMNPNYAAEVSALIQRLGGGIDCTIMDAKA